MWGKDWLCGGMRGCDGSRGDEEVGEGMWGMRGCGGRRGNVGVGKEMWR